MRSSSSAIAPRMALPQRSTHAFGFSTGRRSSPGGRRSWGRDRGTPVCRSSCARTWGTPYSCLRASAMHRDPPHITYAGRRGACNSGHPTRLAPHGASWSGAGRRGFLRLLDRRLWAGPGVGVIRPRRGGIGQRERHGIRLLELDYARGVAVGQTQ